TVFAFDAGEELSEHSAPFDAYVTVLDGRGEFVIAGQTVAAKTGQTVLMPADIPHAVKAVERFKMLLVMIKNEPSG
ncbi:MAG: cupin domain-containing protein, partial [Deltaproteobacteria bacterium]|nr:cupin domain-containing protein [Deltaproteobacteria bacterium]